ncbi:hypothetical protein [Funiculus sociatus]
MASAALAGSIFALAIRANPAIVAGTSPTIAAGIRKRFKRIFFS